jgi:hypothetical protein
MKAKLDDIAKHPALLIIVALATVAAAILAATGPLRSSGPSETSVAPNGVSPFLSVPSSTAPQNGFVSTVPDASPTAGSCLSAGILTPCDKVHDSETYAADLCDRSSLISFLGGDSQIETLRTDIVSVYSSSVAGICQVALTAPVSSSLKGALGSRQGDFLRLCFQGDVNRASGCDQAHTSEATFYRKPGDLAEANCPGRAERYLGAPLSRFAQSLRSEQRDESSGTYCWLTTLGSNKLTHAIRSIGYNTLPLTSR